MAKINVTNIDIAQLTKLANLGDITIQAEEQYLTVSNKIMRLKLDKLSIENSELEFQNMTVKIPRIILQDGKLEAELTAKVD